MAKVKKPTKKSSSSKRGPKQIQDAYVNYVLEHERKPANVYQFCKSLGITEDAFYQLYSSFKALEKSIWKEYAVGTIGRIEADDNYSKFTSREKILAFYFTLIEELRSNRSFVLIKIRKWKIPAVTPTALKKFKVEFEHWAEEVIEEGKATSEIAKRPYLDKRYVSLLWLHLNFILKFWSYDDSNDFEKTDEAIEKSVNLAFDVIGKGFVDNAFEFGKFLYQQRKF